ncbi:aldo/keto reductase [Agromyces atrinae]|uniref:Aldo/keto reductase n=1 Tax=Agromyces atrinae TaxID=592376 RepID=A0A4Q2M334_9MICO|nr:aldo/keto reductase [Agromyces atrinae]NYD65837.1 aryl-alcohol dehydrogenase-like predicted oxidoreductase [Agromyces atrinae]RXZ86188.1 aldo/keto reductase [Agromyces atrinae]
MTESRTVQSASTRDTVLVETNPLSGPISVPAPRRRGDLPPLLAPLVLGTNMFGTALDSHAAVDILDRFLSNGGSAIDIAHDSVAGRAELIVGAWLRSRERRDHVIVSTRAGRNGAATPAALRSAVDGSLARLGVSRIDILFLGDDVNVPLEDSLGEAERLISAGKVGLIAAADFTADRLLEARILASVGLPRFHALRTRYNLVQRRAFEGELELVARGQDLPVFASFPLAGGYLAGPERDRVAARIDPNAERLARHPGRRGHRVRAAVARIADDRGVAPASIALAWLLARRAVYAPVMNATRPAHADALLGAAMIRLTRGDMVDLDRASA